MSPPLTEPSIRWLHTLVVLDVALVGTGGMMPLPNRWLSSVLIRHNGRLILFDCGEGTQISLRSLRWGASPPEPPLGGTPHRPTPAAGEGQGGVHIVDIDLILISHLHGDHVTGLPGLVLTQGNSGRTEPLQIVGPPGLGATVAGLFSVVRYLPFAVQCTELAAGDRVGLEKLSVTCVEGEHHVACLAYRLDLPRRPRFLSERARRLGVPIQDWKRLQRGEVVDGVSPSDVLGPPRRGLSIGLVTDTRPTGAIARLVSDVDLLVCEATFGSDADRSRALERKHMTFREAAELAKAARARQLVLTHFSPALVEPQAYLNNAAEVFPSALVGRDHLTLSLRFPEE